MLLRMFAIFIALIACIACGSCTIVISNSVSTAAGTVSYSMDYPTGAGFLTQTPTEKLDANNNYISIAVGGMSVKGALGIDGSLNAQAANGAKASAETNIKGPGAGISNYNLYGYVTPTLAWAGQYYDSATGTYIWSSTEGTAVNSKWAGSVILSNQADSPVFTVNGLYQDAMATDRWTMADIYGGKASVNSPNNANNWIDVYTGRQFYVPAGTNAYVNGVNYISINGQSMAYVDPDMSYCTLDYTTQGSKNTHSYWYINTPLGINEQKTVFY